MKFLFLLIIVLIIRVNAQQCELDIDPNHSILANVGEVWHLSPQEEGSVSIISINTEAALRPFDLYMIANTGVGGGAAVKIWKLPHSCLSVIKVMWLPSKRGILIEALIAVEIIENGHGRTVKDRINYVVTWPSLESLSGGGGVKKVPPEVEIEKPK